MCPCTLRGEQWGRSEVTVCTAHLGHQTAGTDGFFPANFLVYRLHHGEGNSWPLTTVETEKKKLKIRGKYQHCNISFPVCYEQDINPVLQTERCQSFYSHNFMSHRGERYQVYLEGCTRRKGQRVHSDEADI